VRRHLDSQGYEFAEHIPPHSSRLLAELKKTSDEWLSLPGRTEHTFTEGRYETEYLNRVLIYTVSSPEKQILAFTNRVPSYLPDICTADLMRHKAKIPHGIMEYLFTKLMLLLYERGYHKFSLSLAPFSGVGSGPHPGLSERLIHLVYKLTNRFYSFKGLRHFKSQFEPEWIDRYLFYQEGFIGLIRALLALSRITSLKYNTRHKLISHRNEFKI
jgi:phosphatidylglycerol lysyltransferase